MNRLKLIKVSTLLFLDVCAAIDMFVLKKQSVNIPLATFITLTHRHEILSKKTSTFIRQRQFKIS